MKDSQPKKKARKDRGRKHERPLSLAPLSFDDAVSKLLAVRPKEPPKKKTQT
jgi:hypothetical protein